MKHEALYPFRLRPIFKERIWGGRNLTRLLGKDLPAGVPVGESWEIADDSVILNGPLAGQRLAAAATALGPPLVGSLVADRHDASFPLLIKFIDARDRLSVQVHPDDAFALREEGVAFGKTEMWYVLDAVDGAEVIHGIAPERLTAEEVAHLARNGGLIDHLCRVKVETGDVVFIPAGTVHAMGAGLVVCEVQQNCDVTYRLYDWDRRDTEGRPRPLHVEKAAAVSRFGPLEHKIPRLTLERPCGRYRPLAACRYFAVELLELVAPLRCHADGRSFVSLCVLAGKGEVIWHSGRLAAQSGDSLVIPAAMGDFELRPAAGPWPVLLARVPDLAVDVVQPLLEAGIDRADILRLGGASETNDLADLLR